MMKRHLHFPKISTIMFCKVDEKIVPIKGKFFDHHFGTDSSIKLNIRLNVIHHLKNIYHYFQRIHWTDCWKGFIIKWLYKYTKILLSNEKKLLKILPKEIYRFFTLPFHCQFLEEIINNIVPKKQENDSLFESVWK